MGKVRYKIDAKHEWDERTSLTQATKYTVPFFDRIIRSTIPVSPRKKRCIELGAIPGGYLAYFANEFGYRPTGVDFAANRQIFDKTMKLNGIKDYDFFSEDVMSFSSKEKYDLVCSFGFIEHFDDIERVLRKHEELLASNGLLLVTVPNFRFVQWVYHRIFDRKNLAIHNTKAMKIGYVSRVLEGMGLKLICTSAVGPAEFWYDDPLPAGLFSRIRTKVTSVMNRRLRFISNNKIFSPYIVYLYRRG